LLRFRDVHGDVDHVSFEMTGKPAVASFVIVEQENADGMAVGSYPREAKFVEYCLKQVHPLF
jgi:hypothetical protein